MQQWQPFWPTFDDDQTTRDAHVKAMVQWPTSYPSSTKVVGIWEAPSAKNTTCRQLLWTNKKNQCFQTGKFTRDVNKLQITKPHIKENMLHKNDRAGKTKPSFTVPAPPERERGREGGREGEREQIIGKEMSLWMYWQPWESKCWHTTRCFCFSSNVLTRKRKEEKRAEFNLDVCKTQKWRRNLLGAIKFKETLEHSASWHVTWCPRYTCEINKPRGRNPRRESRSWGKMLQVR